MNEIARPGFYIRTYDRDIFITEAQHSTIMSELNGDTKHIEIGNTLIMVNQIKEIIPSDEYHKSVTGGYYCHRHKDNFVPKGKTCGYCR